MADYNIGVDTGSMDTLMSTMQSMQQSMAATMSNLATTLASSTTSAITQVASSVQNLGQTIGSGPNFQSFGPPAGAVYGSLQPVPMGGTAGSMLVPNQGFIGNVMGATGFASPPMGMTGGEYQYMAGQQAGQSLIRAASAGVGTVTSMLAPMMGYEAMMGTMPWHEGSTARTLAGGAQWAAGKITGQIPAGITGLRSAAAAVGNVAAGIGGVALPMAAGGALFEFGSDAYGAMKENWDIQDNLERNSFRYFRGNFGKGFKRTDRQETSRFVQELGVKEMTAAGEAGGKDLAELMQRPDFNSYMLGTRDVDDFKQKMETLVKNVKNVAITLNESFKQATDTVMDLKRMGITDQTQVFQASTGVRAAAMASGFTGSEMMGFVKNAGQQFMGTRTSQATVMPVVETSIAMMMGAKEAGGISDSLMANMGGVQSAASRVSQVAVNFAKNNTDMKSLYAAMVNEDGSVDESVMDKYLSGGQSKIDVLIKGAANMATPRMRAKAKAMMPQLMEMSADKMLPALFQSAQKNAEFIAQTQGVDMDDAMRLSFNNMAGDEATGEVLYQMSKKGGVGLERMIQGVGENTRRVDWQRKFEKRSPMGKIRRDWAELTESVGGFFNAGVNAASNKWEDFGLYMADMERLEENPTRFLTEETRRSFADTQQSIEAITSRRGYESLANIPQTLQKTPSGFWGGMYRDATNIAIGTLTTLGEATGLIGRRADTRSIRDANIRKEIDKAYDVAAGTYVEDAYAHDKRFKETQDIRQSNLETGSTTLALTAIKGMSSIGVDRTLAGLSPEAARLINPIKSALGIGLDAKMIGGAGIIAADMAGLSQKALSGVQGLTDIAGIAGKGTKGISAAIQMAIQDANTAAEITNFITNNQKILTGGNTLFNTADTILKTAKTAIPGIDAATGAALVAGEGGDMAKAVAAGSWAKTGGLFGVAGSMLGLAGGALSGYSDTDYLLRQTGADNWLGSAGSAVARGIGGTLGMTTIAPGWGALGGSISGAAMGLRIADYFKFGETGRNIGMGIGAITGAATGAAGFGGFVQAGSALTSMLIPETKATRGPEDAVAPTDFMQSIGQLGYFNDLYTSGKTRVSRQSPGEGWIATGQNANGQTVFVEANAAIDAAARYERDIKTDPSQRKRDMKLESINERETKELQNITGIGGNVEYSAREADIKTKYDEEKKQVYMEETNSARRQENVQKRLAGTQKYAKAAEMLRSTDAGDQAKGRVLMRNLVTEFTKDTTIDKEVAEPNKQAYQAAQEKLKADFEKISLNKGQIETKYAKLSKAEIEMQRTNAAMDSWWRIGTTAIMAPVGQILDVLGGVGAGDTDITDNMIKATPEEINKRSIGTAQRRATQETNRDLTKTMINNTKVAEDKLREDIDLATAMANKEAKKEKIISPAEAKQSEINLRKNEEIKRAFWEKDYVKKAGLEKDQKAIVDKYAIEIGALQQQILKSPNEEDKSKLRDELRKKESEYEKDVSIYDASSRARIKGVLEDANKYGLTYGTIEGGVQSQGVDANQYMQDVRTGDTYFKQKAIRDKATTDASGARAILSKSDATTEQRQYSKDIVDFYSRAHMADDDSNINKYRKIRESRAALIDKGDVGKEDLAKFDSAAGETLGVMFAKEDAIKKGMLDEKDTVGNARKRLQTQLGVDEAQAAKMLSDIGVSGKDTDTTGGISAGQYKKLSESKEFIEASRSSTLKAPDEGGTQTKAGAGKSSLSDKESKSLNDWTQSMSSLVRVIQDASLAVKGH